MTLEPEEVLGAFTIKDENGDVLTGFITNCFDEDGNETFDVRDAEQYVGFCHEGAAAGKWLRWQACECDEWNRVAVN